MNTERYAGLAEAYGSDINRWPADQREAALAWRDREPEAARRILAEAALLDEALDAWRPPAASAHLRDRILATAPRARTVRKGLGFWLSGAGLAAAGVAGVIVGVTACNAALTDVRADELLAAASPDDASAAFSDLTVSARQVVRSAV